MGVEKIMPKICWSKQCLVNDQKNIAQKILALQKNDPKNTCLQKKFVPKYFGSKKLDN